MPVTFSAYHPSRLHQFQVASWHFCKDWRVWDTSERTCPDGNLGQWFSNLESISPSLCRTGARTIVKIVCLQGVECDFPPPQGSRQAMTEWDGSRKPYKLPGRTPHNRKQVEVSGNLSSAWIRPETFTHLQSWGALPSHLQSSPDSGTTWHDPWGLRKPLPIPLQGHNMDAVFLPFSILYTNGCCRPPVLNRIDLGILDLVHGLALRAYRKCLPCT